MLQSRIARTPGRDTLLPTATPGSTREAESASAADKPAPRARIVLAHGAERYNVSGRNVGLSN
jgi:hypothetical protein